MLLAFFADGCIYEILEVMKGEESQLALLASKERYEQITGQVRRIVIIEQMEQIEGLKQYQIHGIAGYVTVELMEKHAINIHRKINYKTIIKYLLCNYITSKRTYDRWVIRSFFAEK